MGGGLGEVKGENNRRHPLPLLGSCLYVPPPTTPHTHLHLVRLRSYKEDERIPLGQETC